MNIKELGAAQRSYPQTRTSNKPERFHNNQILIHFETPKNYRIQRAEINQHHNPSSCIKQLKIHFRADPTIKISQFAETVSLDNQS
uniref:Uncharacterized protein n=1 Tax=Cucumis melo TaxID=3656 RepID=A0A9I9EEG7_CUCME